MALFQHLDLSYSGTHIQLYQYNGVNLKSYGLSFTQQTNGSRKETMPYMANTLLKFRPLTDVKGTMGPDARSQLSPVLPCTYCATCAWQ